MIQSGTTMPANQSGIVEEKDMSKLVFNDGITIDNSGTMRIIKKVDGFYIVGQGISCPIDNIEEGQRLISRFMTKYHRTKIEANKENK